MFEKGEQEGRMRAAAIIAGIGTLILAASAMAPASANALTASQWRADLDQLQSSIEEVHPRPFAHMAKEDFDEAVANLRRDIPRLSDKAIIVRMAKIVGMTKDGHTRLAIPRDYPGLGLEFGHSKDPEPTFSSLSFRQLPMAFERFTDGVYVVAADERYSHYVGDKLISIGALAADEALQKLAPYTYAENVQLELLMGADRLSLPEFLAEAGVTESSDGVPIVLEGGGVSPIALTLQAMTGEPQWRRARPVGGGLGPDDMAERKFWSTFLSHSNTVYARIDEITDTEQIRLADFVMNAIAEAEERQARLVFDLRNNFGGNGGLNRTLVLALLQNEPLNRIGRTFVLTGPRTFSAAQMLVNEFERYSWAMLVGEPTGSRPDHFGDARKIRLENSGLTLRVSTLHWSGPMANDGREATSPDLPAPWDSATYFGGADPALAAVAAFDPATTYIDLFEAALRRGDHYQIARYLTLARLSPQSYKDDFAGDLLALGKRFEAEGETELARFSYRYGLFFFADDRDLAVALDALKAGE